MKAASILLAALAGGGTMPASQPTALPGPSRTVESTTQGAIALVNLDQQIQQMGRDPAGLELRLMRLQFVADYEVLDDVAVMADEPAMSASAVLRRARARTALHRFAAAEQDLAAAGASSLQRAGVLIATGRAAEALPALREEAARRRGFSSLAALARAEAAVGRLEEADQHYAEALAMLDTTSPFPGASIAFARGLMWNEQGGDAARGAAFYAEALRLLPDYAAAAIHLAEIELARGEHARAQVRLRRVAERSGEPEALALLGELHRRQGRLDLSKDEILAASRRYEALLRDHPEAFADHAAEFYLGVGQDPLRAWAWSQANLRERPTRRAFQLAIRAAEAVGKGIEARWLRERMASRHGPRSA
jgi:tetratricopeptide (TPR) repeat protein